MTVNPVSDITLVSKVQFLVKKSGKNWSKKSPEVTGIKRDLMLQYRKGKTS